MHREYNFRDQEDISYLELRKQLDKEYLEFQKEWIEKAKIAFLEHFSKVPCPSFVKREYVEHGAKYAYEGYARALADFVPSTKGGDEMVKVFSDFQSLVIDVEKSGFNLPEVVAFFVPEKERYLYFTDKARCNDFIKNNRGTYLVEIIANNIQQNFSFIVAGTKDSVLCEMQKELEAELKKNCKTAEVWLSTHENTVWAHVVGIYFKDFADAARTIGTILSKHKSSIRYPDTKFDKDTYITIWNKIIPDHKLSIEPENKLKKEIMTTDEKMVIINNYTINNTGNNVLMQLGDKNNGIVGNNNVIKDKSSDWVDNNPPGEKEGSNDYRIRLIAGSGRQISPKQLAKLLGEKGYKKVKTDRCYWRKE